MNLVKLIKKLYHKDSEQKWIFSSWKAKNEQKQFIVGLYWDLKSWQGGTSFSDQSQSAGK